MEFSKYRKWNGFWRGIYCLAINKCVNAINQSTSSKYGQRAILLQFESHWIPLVLFSTNTKCKLKPVSYNKLCKPTRIVVYFQVLAFLFSALLSIHPIKFRKTLTFRPFCRHASFQTHIIDPWTPCVVNWQKMFKENLH